MGNKISSQTSKSDDDIRNMALRLDLYAQRIILKEVKKPEKDGFKIIDGCQEELLKKHYQLRII